jgi:phage shock protein PspC (stress-responsive transcriptional regulator)
LGLVVNQTIKLPQEAFMNRHSHYSWFCNKANRKIFGVCSGLAAYYGHSITVVRLIAVLALFAFPGLTFIAYVIAGLVLPARYEV